jgi:cob(I)alamin adenosyltransferase
MVYLSRIYTRNGDEGQTALGNGLRVPKDHPRVAAYGTVDEVNSVLGLLLTTDPLFAEAALVRSIQNDLFDVGADLCVPPAPDEAPQARNRIQPEHWRHLEVAIDRLNQPLPPLTSFILPGGSLAAAWCHLARTVCRRAEREVVTLTRTEVVNPNALIYLNRLSDLLFVLARVLNRGGQQDILWQPGGSLKSPSESTG